MDCPVCNKTMSDEDFGGVQVQVCATGCKSIWFDNQELVKLDASNEGVGQALKNALAAPRSNDAHRAALHCPKCQVPMVAHKYEGEKEVNVDECYTCGGMLVDSGELKVIRDHHMSETEESTYLDKLLNDLPSYQQAEQDLKKKELREKALKQYTRFLRLSYYMTGE
ncbi:MAG: zf-TFIIB domain-containing protein [Xanthomonadales bacterium]|nr:zf-TFIIB domain-containing protein [Xanthomonadales bacterium]